VFQPLKGFRDFTDEEMASRAKVIEMLKRVPLTFGFREIDMPSLEPLEMYKIKSGDEVVAQTFSFRDKSGKEVTLIPETTPTVARLVASVAKGRQMPVKWFSFGKLWRYEEPQAGRLREFCQLNIDTFGSSDVRADAEMVAVAAAVLRELGLETDVKICISDRRLIDGYLDSVGVKEKQSITRIIDKRDKVSGSEMRGMLCSAGLKTDVCDTLESLANIKGRIDERLPEIESMLGKGDATQRLRALGEMIDWYEVSKVCALDLGIMRGFDYYTSFVMEAHDARGEYRALFGGGRYDGLVSLFGGPSIPAVGFAMGDAILEILMRRAGSWPKEAMRTDCVVAIVDDSMFPDAVKFATMLRAKGLIVETDVMGKKLTKQLDYANTLKARWAVIVGPKERESGKVVLRDMKSGEQTTMKVDEAVKQITTSL
jgi:histidyl-tRNA synthetase